MRRFLDLTKVTVLAMPFGTGSLEGSSMAFYEGKYIVAGSGVAGLDSARDRLCAARLPLGPCIEKGLMGEQKTWNGRTGFRVSVRDGLPSTVNEQWRPVP